MKVLYQSSEIHFTSQGNGEPIVLLHGFLESSNIWNPFVEKWSRIRQVICIDLPGHGQSEVVAKVHTMELLAEVVEHVVNQLGLSKIALLGHSMGGYVSLAYLEHYSEKVHKLILLNSIAKADSEERKKTRERAALLVSKNKSAFISMAINNLLHPDNYEMFKDDLKNMKSQALEFPSQGIIAALLGMSSRRDRTEVLNNFKGEKFFVAGKDDPILSVEAVREQSVQTQALLYELPGGHLSFLESRKGFEQIMKVII